MFLGIQDAVDDIVSAIKDSLGPVTHINDMTSDVIFTTLIDAGIQLVATIILFIVIRFFFWKPITEILEKRREVIDKDLDAARQAKENAIEIEATLKTELAQARLQIKEKLDKAERDGIARRDQIVNDAKEEAKRRMASLENELEQEKKNMEKEIKQEIVDIAFELAEKIVAKEIDQDKYLNVVEYIIKDGASQ